MLDSKLKQLVAEAVSLDREISSQQERLKELKSRLIIEAQSRLDEATETEGGGKAITFPGAGGDVARVSIPAPALKSKFDSDGKPFEKIKAAAGRFFPSLFATSVVYVPVDGFRTEAANLLGREAGKLIKLCETESRPRVCFETKEPRAAN